MDISEWKDFKKTAEKFTRGDMSKRVMHLVLEFLKDYSYKGAIELAGRLHVWSLVSRHEYYWDEKCRAAHLHEYHHIDDLPYGDGDRDCPEWDEIESIMNAKKELEFFKKNLEEKVCFLASDAGWDDPEDVARGLIEELEQEWKESNEKED